MGLADLNKKLCGKIDKNTDAGIAFAQNILSSVKEGAEGFESASGKELTKTKTLLVNTSADLKEDVDNLKKMNPFCKDMFNDELRKIDAVTSGFKKMIDDLNEIKTSKRK